MLILKFSFLGDKDVHGQKMQATVIKTGLFRQITEKNSF